MKPLLHRSHLLLILLVSSLCWAHELSSLASASIRTTSSYNRRRGETTNELSVEENDKTPPQMRECDWNADSFEVYFGCKAATADDASTEIQDEIDFTIQTSYKGVGVFVEYKQESSDATGSTSQAYDWNQDTVIKTLYLLEWNDFTEVTTNGLISHFSVTTPQGVATFNFTFSQERVSQELSANKLKLDFWLNDLTWKEREDTYVALMSHVESERNIELDYDGDNSVGSVMPRNAIISFQQEGTVNDDLVPFGEFTWQDNAQAIDNTTQTTSNGNVTVQVERAAELGTTIQVVATSPPVQGERQPGDKSSEFIAFSFVGEGAQSASEIYWDPEAGVGYGTPTSTSGVDRVAGSSTLFNAVIVVCIIGTGVFSLSF